jgi:hypothetical protein
MRTHINRGARLGLFFLLSACGVPWIDNHPTPAPSTTEDRASANTPVARDISPMSGPVTMVMPMERQGAALVLAHAEPVLRLPPTPTVAPIAPLDALRKVRQGEREQRPASVESTEELVRLATAFYRFCHHWPEPDDLMALIAHGLITPGQQASEACPSLD